MHKLLKFNYRKAGDRGFTTLEILISIIVALAFVSFTMQSFVLAMAMKVQAQEKQRANQLIQEDLERIGELATRITEDHNNKCNPANYADGYAKQLWDFVEPTGATNPSVRLLRKADGTESGKTLTLDRTPISGGSSTAPHRTLKINYQVTVSPNNDVVAERYVEVIPDVALRCP